MERPVRGQVRPHLHHLRVGEERQGDAQRGEGPVRGCELSIVPPLVGTLTLTPTLLLTLTVTLNLTLTLKLTLTLTLLLMPKQA